MDSTVSRNREKEIFDQALDFESSAEREVFLQKACAANDALLERIRTLLKANDEVEDFLPGSPVESPSEGSVTVTERAGDRIGRYKLLQKIGEGGCGVVYMAEQEEPVSRRVALKIIKLGMDTRSVVARFEAERQALAMMDHPNIARVFDGGATETGRPFFVMELVRGVRITEYCDEHSLNTRERLELFIKVCQAIQHAHQKAIIHRDIKPSNVLVTVNDGVAVPKVIDFGTAKGLQQKLTDKTLFTRFQAFIGTPAYMSPEQADMSSLDIDTRSDIYSLGVLLYELLTGRTPFDGAELMRGGLDEVRRTLRQREPARPSTRLSKLSDADLTTTAERRRTDAPRLVHSLRGDLDWIVMKCLEKDRTRRYETANGLAKDIERFLNNEPVTACPPSTWYRLGKTIRRNRLAFTAGAVVAITLAAGLGVSTWMFLKERAAQREQSRLRVEAEQESAAAREAAERLRLQSYASDMKLAQVAVQENNFGRAVELLQRWAPGKNADPAQDGGRQRESVNASLRGKKDLRGLEWRYLWQASRSSSLHTFDHDVVVNAATLSPDGRFLATGSLDQRAHVWDVASHTQLAQFQGSVELQGVAWSSDGHLLAVGERNRLVLRETSGWQMVREWPGEARHMAWSPDGGILATYGGHALRLWDTALWENTTLFTHSNEFARLAFSQDSKQLAVSYAGLVQVWDVANHTPLHQFEIGTRVTSVALSPDKHWLGAGQSTGKVFLWNLDTDRLVVATNAHSSWAFGLVFSMDNKTLITGGSDQVIRFWKLPSIPAGDSASLDATVTPAPRTLEQIGALNGHRSEIWGLELSRDGTLLVSASKDGTARIWKAMPKSEEGDWLRLKPGNAQILGFSGDSPRLRVLKDNTTIEEWDVRTKLLTRSFTLPVKSAVRSDGSEMPLLLAKKNRAWIPLVDGSIEAWDLESTNRLRKFQVSTHGVLPLQLSLDGKHIALLERERSLASLWKTEDGEREAELPAFPVAGHYDFNAAAFSPDSRLFAYGSSNYTVKVWDIAAHRELHTLRGHVWRIYAVAFSPDGQLLATASWDGRVRLWRTASGTEAMPPLTAHLGGVRVLHFTRDGLTLLAADDANTVRAWHVATGQEMLTLARWFPFPQSICSPDGSVLVLEPPAANGDLRLMPLPSLEQIDLQGPFARVGSF